MGKRKERRLAAKIGAGRRVKLDLFAEPCGDLGGSSAKDEVGKDKDAKPDAELSNSPSSSGQNEDNPLSLLGQYSDDELDQESNETGNVDKDSSSAPADQTKVSVSTPAEEGEIVEDEDPSVQNADGCNPEMNSGLVSASQTQIVEAVTDDKHHVVSKENIDHAHVVSGAQTAGDASSCWKMVLHEESNQYYYWNTVTGETSWVVPEALSQATGTAGGHEAVGTGVKEIAAGDVNASGTAFGVKSEGFSTIDSAGYVNGPSDVVAVCEYGPQANQTMEQSRGDGIQSLGSSNEVGAVPCETATLVNYTQYNQVNVGGVSASALGYEVHGYSISDQAAVDPLHLISHGEALLDRLKSLQWCGFDSEEHGWISKYISEVEIRLSDIKTLLPYGPSLVPFWLHSERQLNQVENGINTEIERQKNKISGMHLSAAEGDKDKEDREEESKVKEDTTKSSPENSSAILHDDDASVIQKASHDEAANVEISNVKQVSVDCHPTHLQGTEEGGQDIDGTFQREESPNSGFQTGEDVDMDVDMEVEDPIPAREVALDRGGQSATPSEQLAQPNVSEAEEPLGTECEFIPPPPDDEWIPPPPPDNEEIPPPPPDDEPPESLCPLPPPAEPEPVQSVYSGPYNLPYAESGVNYYGSTTTGTLASSFYANVDGTQMSVVNPTVYYAAVPNVQQVAAPAASTSAMYYGLQNGGMPVVPLDPTIGAFGFQAASSLVNGDPLSNQIATADASAGASLLSNQFIEPHSAGAKTDVGSTEASSSIVSAPTTVSVKEYVSVPSLSASAASVSATSTSKVSDTSTTVSKAQPKATRMKKPKVNVASSLRSNKKVSSLVDKWKAAKEELDEEEEKVPESRLEILEKKRQREIEEWRAQQIASGEAKENANFQPLGGDWRERVKRKRAKKEPVSDSSSETVSNKSKQPDLDQLSKDLPSGWQAFWDESTKQVYYGNSITSETTWTKPGS